MGAAALLVLRRVNIVEMLEPRDRVADPHLLHDALWVVAGLKRRADSGYRRLGANVSRFLSGCGDHDLVGFGHSLRLYR